MWNKKLFLQDAVRRCRLVDVFLSCILRSAAEYSEITFLKLNISTASWAMEDAFGADFETIF